MRIRKKRVFMYGKKLLSAVLAAVLASGLCSMPAMAASRKKIMEVKMTVTAQIMPGDSISQQQAEVTVDNSRVGVGDSEFINDGFQWYEGDVPKMEVKLYADEGYYFATDEKGIIVTGGTYIKQKREDLSRTLTVTIDLPKVGEYTQSITRAEWGNGNLASWAKTEGTGSYEIILYRDGKSISDTLTTKGTSIDFTNQMRNPGSYTYQVRPVNDRNPEQKGQWFESSSKYIDAATAEKNRSTGEALGEWKQNQNGWWYSYQDGGYPVNRWESIGGKWYYFNDKGYMATGWISTNGKQYYCNPLGGAMVVNTKTPDGFQVGADGARIS